MSNKPPEFWVEKLSKTEMPVLSSVIKQLTRLAGDDDSNVNQLVEVILKDPHLTTQILRISNSVKYNPQNSCISTVSRAIVMLGFRAVRSLCISLVVVDSLLGKAPRERLLQVMAKAFHAAVQARDIYKKVEDKKHEEVFIAALLHNLGEMAFWAYGGQTADQLDQDLQMCMSGGQELIEKELGISFKNLTRELGKVWNLGDTLQEALTPGNKISKKAQAVRLGEAISNLSQDDKIGRSKLIKQVADFTGGALEDTRKLVDNASESSASVALEFGASQVCHLMPNKRGLEKKQKRQTQTMQVLKADVNLQLKVLRDLANSVSDNLDVNTVFQMALEGMHRGIGLERMVLAFFRQDKLVAKYVLGQSTEGWREKFNFTISEGAANIFADCLLRPQPFWLDEQYLKTHEHLYSEQIVTTMGKHPAFIGILRVNRRNAALFYADRGFTEEKLTKDQFDSFKHFLSQAELAIQTIADGK